MPPLCSPCSCARLALRAGKRGGRPRPPIPWGPTLDIHSVCSCISIWLGWFVEAHRSLAAGRVIDVRDLSILRDYDCNSSRPVHPSNAVETLMSCDSFIKEPNRQIPEHDYTTQQPRDAITQLNGGASAGGQLGVGESTSRSLQTPTRRTYLRMNLLPMSEVPKRPKPPPTSLIL